MRQNFLQNNPFFRMAAVSILVGILLAFAGAFNTSDIYLGVRLAYWIITIFVGNLIAYSVSLGLDKVKFLEDRLLVYHTFHLAIICILITILVVGVNSFVFDLKFDFRMMIRISPGVFVISLFMTIVHLVLSQIPQQSHASSVNNSSNPEIAFYERLPFKFKKANILAINAEDHYLRVHTDNGDTMILMRLYDAIKELEGIEGSQTHRSWWVAKDAISEIVKGDGRISFRLKNNEIAPVSRSFHGVLKAQNWF